MHRYSFSRQVKFGCRSNPTRIRFLVPAKPTDYIINRKVRKNSRSSKNNPPTLQPQIYKTERSTKSIRSNSSAELHIRQMLYLTVIYFSNLVTLSGHNTDVLSCSIFSLLFSVLELEHHIKTCFVYLGIIYVSM
jgi:hypothetical protein